MLSEAVRKMCIGRNDKFMCSKTAADEPSIRQPLIQGDPTHVCALCGKVRSRRYQRSHPLVRGEVSVPGICRRPTCAPAQMARGEVQRCQLVVVEVHHYYHRTADSERTTDLMRATEMPGESSLNGRAEVLGDLRYQSFPPRYTQGQFGRTGEEPPPPVKRDTKPTLQTS